MKEPKLCRYCRYLKMNTKTIDGYTFVQLMNQQLFVRKN